MKTPWCDRDNELGLRTEFAKLIASKISGVSPRSVTPSEDDFTMADVLGALVEKEACSRE